MWQPNKCSHYSGCRWLSKFTMSSPNCSGNIRTKNTNCHPLTLKPILTLSHPFSRIQPQLNMKIYKYSHNVLDTFQQSKRLYMHEWLTFVFETHLTLFLTRSINTEYSYNVNCRFWQSKWLIVTVTSIEVATYLTLLHVLSALFILMVREWPWKFIWTFLKLLRNPHKSQNWWPKSFFKEKLSQIWGR